MGNIETIFSQFNCTGNLVRHCPYGNGHINSTHKIEVELDDNSTAAYIMQRINENVFKDIDGLMSNIAAVVAHIEKKTLENGGDDSQCLKLIKTKNGSNYYADETGAYRCYNFITAGVSIESTPTNEQLFISGKGFGCFQRHLDDFSVNCLKETIPNFHNTPSRFNALLEAIELNLAGRRDSVRDEIDFFLNQSSYVSIIVDKIANGLIPSRVTHNDTKLNNVLIDIVNNKPVTVIDLDTVMSGSIIYDFGDAIRSGANLASEDERDLSLVKFSLDAYKAFARGFMPEVVSILEPTEFEYMHFGPIVMTLECGMRFLTDHLNGDKYFRIHRKNHNLDRARTQIKLLEDMKRHISQMRIFIESFKPTNSNC
ncbi:MAG: aminoglycoside phosphotransferase family protein [Christensenellaceae bacterium]|jgi:hypothetical protein|nr:aminoglycoside phosphotransferase family protein [Christensenellaceae bacterium]